MPPCTSVLASILVVCMLMSCLQTPRIEAALPTNPSAVAAAAAALPAGAVAAAVDSASVRSTGVTMTTTTPEDCMALAGFFYDVSSGGTPQCSPCPPGYFCAEGTAAMQPCAPGTFQPLGQRDTCLNCPANTECPSSGMTAYLACPEGRTSASGSAWCSTSCDFEKFYLGAQGQCVARTRFCNFDAEYQVPNAANHTQEFECQPLTQCDTTRLADPVWPIMGPASSLSGVEKISPLREYIAKYHTRYSDRTCWAWNPCGEDDYALQLPLDDGQGFLLQPLVCKPLSGPATDRDQYKLVDGSVTRDRDNVWVDCTRCDARSEFQSRPCTANQDATCRAFTVCDPILQYIQRLGDALHDTLCGRKTLCTRYTERGMYELRPAVDSTSYDVEGTDAACATYSKCPPGTFASFSGSDTRDVQCTPCPPGTFREREDDPEKCTPCARGTFAASAGSIMCLPCTRCGTWSHDDHAHEEQQQQQQGQQGWNDRCPFTPWDQYCTMAAIEPCEADRDAQCAPCASKGDLGGFRVTAEDDGGVCVPCRPGFFYNASIQPYGARCVPCPEGFYCPSVDEVRSCEGLVRVGRVSIATTSLERGMIPWSPQGSTRLAQCTCSSMGGVGGFELAPASLRGLGAWCIPCEAGKFAPAALHAGSGAQTNLACEACPAGTFSSSSAMPVQGATNAQHGTWYDLAKCTESSILDGTCAHAVTSGPVECTPCPIDRPYTWTWLAKSEDECHACPQDHYYYYDYYLSSNGGECKPCSAPCQGPDLFELIPCTERGDRACASCSVDDNACDPVHEYLDLLRACPGAIDIDRACAPCIDAMKPEHSDFVDSGGSYRDGTKRPCAWRCHDGYYSPPGSETCIPCTPLTAQNCLPGFVRRECTRYADATCTEACDPVALRKPPGQGSEWIWTSLDAASKMLVASPTPGTEPNAGCLWACSQGYVVRHMAVAEGQDPIAFCVSEELS